MALAPPRIPGGGPSPVSQLRIFSYLPNPRIWKATIAAWLTGVRLDIRGAKPAELGDWLWDFDARPLSREERAGAEAARVRAGFARILFKTAAYLDAHPFGTVPAAFSRDGRIGVFGSNSIMRAVARMPFRCTELTLYRVAHRRFPRRLARLCRGFPALFAGAARQRARCGAAREDTRGVRDAHERHRARHCARAAVSCRR